MNAILCMESGKKREWLWVEPDALRSKVIRGGRKPGRSAGNVGFNAASDFPREPEVLAAVRRWCEQADHQHGAQNAMEAAAKTRPRELQS